VIHFQAIALPGLAYRRSYFAEAILRQTSTFVRLLCQLAPDRYARLQDKSPMSVYWELLNCCGTLFPTFEPDFDDYFDEGSEPETEYDIAAEAEQFGIPLDLQGVNDDDLVTGSSPTLCFIAYLSDIGPRTSVKELGEGTGESFRHIETLEPFFDRELESFNCAQPPRGREWAGDWRNITDLVNYVQHNTDLMLIDNSDQLMWESGEGYGPWNMEHIRYYTECWKAAEPVFDRITALRKWIDARPENRLPLLAAAITGDKFIRRQLSQPKKSKRLIEVL
jgi:hypothetical protein